MCPRCDRFLGHIWRRSHPTVFGSLRRAGADRHTADEVASAVFAVAWRRLDTVPDEAHEIDRWLCAVGRWILRNEHRRAGRDARRVEAIAHVEERATARDQTADPILERTRMLELWRRLPARDADILLRAAWHGIGLDGLAAHMGCTRGSAAMRLSRARARLAAAE